MGPGVQSVYKHLCAYLYRWQEGYFTLLTCAEQMDELRATCTSQQSPRASSLIMLAAWSIKQRGLATSLGALPHVERSTDPTDDLLLALSEAGEADYLVTGDKSGLLALDYHKATRIISASGFAALFG